VSRRNDFQRSSRQHSSCPDVRLLSIHCSTTLNSTYSAIRAHLPNPRKSICELELIFLLFIQPLSTLSLLVVNPAPYITNKRTVRTRLSPPLSPRQSRKQISFWSALHEIILLPLSTFSSHPTPPLSVSSLSCSTRHSFWTT
jgi:hypothetical protein